MISASLFLRALVVGLVIAAAEVLQGVLRVRFLNRRLGDRRARQLGVVVGSGAILAIAWTGLPWIGARSGVELLGVGFVWLVLMLALDLWFGRVVFRFSWSRIARDFDPRRGGWLGFGMLVLLAAPLLAALLRNGR